MVYSFNENLEKTQRALNYIFPGFPIQQRDFSGDWNNDEVSEDPDESIQLSQPQQAARMQYQALLDQLKNEIV